MVPTAGASLKKGCLGEGAQSHSSTQRGVRERRCDGRARRPGLLRGPRRVGREGAGVPLLWPLATHGADLQTSAVSSAFPRLRITVIEDCQYERNEVSLKMSVPLVAAT